MGQSRSGRASAFLLARALAAVALLAGASGCDSGGAGASLQLVEREDATVEAPEGRYPAFTTPADRALVEIAGGARLALTPPFPGKVSFEVTIPDSGRLRFYPALVSRRAVRRAMVDYLVTVDGAVVYRETFDFTDANLWHEREVDLGDLSGREVTLALETRPFRGGADKLWADRVQTAWGEPALVAGASLAALDRFDPSSATGASLRELEAWLEAEAPSLRFDAAGIFRFAVSLLLGGLLALAIRGLYLRLEANGTARPRRSFANLFPLFTLSTVLVITVVAASAALSLGLLGALSIVRFRSSIKTPREIAYLLFCIGVGLCLGARLPWLAVLAVVVTSLFELLRRILPEPKSEASFVLTVTGDARDFDDGDAEPMLSRLRGLLPEARFRRLERRDERVELSTLVRVARRDGAEATGALSRSLAERFPNLDIACVDARLDSDGLS